jgi:hypothetical protein
MLASHKDFRASQLASPSSADIKPKMSLTMRLYFTP